jgi:hypothetical protein
VTPGAEPADLAANETRKRTIYGLVSRRKLDGTLALFDFPNPNATGEQRNVTATALQQLFFLNSDFVDARARKLAADAAKATDRVGFLYRAVFSRNPEPERAEAEYGIHADGQGPVDAVGQGAAQLERIPVCKLRTPIMNRRDALKTLGTGFGMIGLANNIAAATRPALYAESEIGDLPVFQRGPVAGRYV